MSRYSSRLIDIERLTMLGAPRSSAERTHVVLDTLAAEYCGTAYWIDIDWPRAFCFDRVSGPLAPDTSFASEGFPRAFEALIPCALTTMGAHLIAERDEALHSLLVPVHGRRGHRMGLVGLTLAQVPPGFDPTALRRRVMVELDAGSKAG